jgi:hypothetical protein
MSNDREYEHWKRVLWLTTALRTLTNAACYLGQTYSESDSLGWRDEGAEAAFIILVEREQQVRGELRKAIGLKRAL